MEKLYIIFEDKKYILLHQYSSGYCEIVEEGDFTHNVKLVHF
ncbi:hypothetical protein [Bacillus salipaludis]|nr:hypothetical protein [Bacillus salipaludis]